MIISKFKHKRLLFYVFFFMHNYLQFANVK